MSSRYRQQRHQRDTVEQIIRQIPTDLNWLNNLKPIDEKLLRTRGASVTKRGKVPKVQESVFNTRYFNLKYLERRPNWFAAGVTFPDRPRFAPRVATMRPMYI